jgi:hypothetical protein
MGLLDLLIPGVGSNPFYKAFDQNRGKITGAFSGLAGAGNDPRAALQGWVGGLQHGVNVDQENALIRQKQEEQQAAIDQQKQEQAQITTWLQQNRPDLANLPPAEGLKMAQAATGDGPNDPSSVQEYKFYANQEIQAGRPPLSYADWRKGSNQTLRAGMGAPIWGKNRTTGEYMPFEPMSDGTIVSLVDQNAKATDFLFDPGTVASDKAAGAAYGGAQGGVQFNLPAAKQNIDVEIANIDRILANKQGLDEVFGTVAGFIPQQWLPTTAGTPKADAQEQIKQVVGQNFLQAFASLKGAGAITEVEGTKAQDAMARLSTAQTRKAFEEALVELKGILKLGYDRMSGQATMGPYQSNGFAPPPLANTGAPVDYRTYFGGQ